MLIGAQFNQNLFARELLIASGKTIPGTQVPPDCLADLEQRLKALRPHFVRVFFNPHQDAGPPSTRQSFVETVQLAEAAGATINITVQSVWAYAAGTPVELKAFAAVLAELVQTYGITNVRWVTLQNEPNTPGLKQINPPLLSLMYRALDRELLASGVRSGIRFMAGDLIEGGELDPAHRDPVLPPKFDERDSDWRRYTNEAYWLAWMEHHMADVVDAYSLHIYWDAIDDMPPHPLKFESRLKTMSGVSKPFYVTEFGARGKRPAGAQGPGTLPDGVPVEKSNLAAFQHAWFQIAAAKLGCAGTSKWDAYYAIYDASPQSYYAIGEPVGTAWACYPMYYLLWLFTNATVPGWKAGSVRGDMPSWAAVAEFRGDPTGVTVFGLDTRWATRNEKSKEQSSFAVPTGLAKGTRLAFLVWNHDGGGRVVLRPPATVGDRGTVTITIPQHAVFALTTNAPPAVPA